MSGLESARSVFVCDDTIWKFSASRSLILRCSKTFQTLTWDSSWIECMFAFMPEIIFQTKKKIIWCLGLRDNCKRWGFLRTRAHCSVEGLKLWTTEDDEAGSGLQASKLVWAGVVNWLIVAESRIGVHNDLRVNLTSNRRHYIADQLVWPLLPWLLLNIHSMKLNSGFCQNQSYSHLLWA